jgi:integrase
VRRNILDKISEKYGANPYELLEPKHVRTLIRDPKADFPEAANGYVKALRQVFKWAVEVGHADKNPAKEVPLLKSNNPDGWHTWTEEEIHKFEYRHPIGSKARLALALGLYTGARKSDAIRLGRQMERNGFLCFTEQKGETIKRKDREVPILEQLRKVIDATPSDHLTYLVTEFGKPYSSGGFGNWFRRRCNEAGLPHCSFHGLRKAGATIAANNGATGHQLMAMFGWDSLKQAARYTEKANRNKLAGDAMHLLVPGHTENKSVSPNTVINSGETNKEKKA